MHRYIFRFLFSVLFSLSFFLHAHASVDGQLEPSIKNHAKTLRELSPLAAQEDTATQRHLGVMYMEENGVTKKLIKVRKQFDSAAQSIALAQDNLRSMYAEDCGTAQEHIAVVPWYRKVTDPVNAICEPSPSFICDEGRGVKQDDAGAMPWHCKSAEQGDEMRRHISASCMQGTNE